MSQSGEIIVDSGLTPAEAICSNPAKAVCPKYILNQQCLLTVHYVGFDGALHRGQMVIREDLTTDIHDFFLLAKRIGFPIQKVVPLAHPDYLWDRDKTVLRDNLTHGFNYRTVHDTDRLSNHAYGAAFDVNPMQNPYIRTKKGEQIVWPPLAIQS